MPDYLEINTVLPDVIDAPDDFEATIRQASPTTYFGNSLYFAINANKQLTPSAYMPQPYHRNITYDEFTADALTDTITLITFPAGTFSVYAIAKTSVAFAGPSITEVQLDVGVTATPALFIDAWNTVDETVSATNFAEIESDQKMTFQGFAQFELTAKLTCTGANCSALTAGALDLTFVYFVIKQTAAP